MPCQGTKIKIGQNKIVQSCRSVAKTEVMPDSSHNIHLLCCLVA